MAVSSKDLTFRIKSLALEMGFDAVAVTKLESLEGGERYLQEWIQEGRHGSMKYLKNYQARRKYFLKTFPDAESVIVLGVNYHASEPAPPSARSSTSATGATRA